MFPLYPIHDASGAFLTALLEPLLYRRKIVLYELFFGAIALLGLLLIFNAEFDKLYGILIALLSAVLSVFFTLINGKLAQRPPASTVTFYELTIGFVALTAFCLWHNDFSLSPFVLQGNDWVYLLILGSICTAYAFIVSVQVMQQSPLYHYDYHQYGTHLWNFNGIGHFW